MSRQKVGQNRGMILLEPGNRILAETVGSVINAPADEKVDVIDVTLCDFDDTSYRVQIDDSKTTLNVSLSCPCYTAIEDNGGSAAVEKHYGDLKKDPTDAFHVSLGVDLSTLAGMKQEEKDALVERIKLFKSNVVGGVFHHYFDQLNEGKKEKPFKFDLRSDTTVYFFPGADRVVVIFELDFTDKTDRAIAKIFMQEFQDARRSLGRAPPCMFSHAPPRELEYYNITENDTNVLGYLSFAVLKGHISDDKKKDTAVRTLQTFRNYIQYHIKCSKAYFHSRMRARVRGLLKVLNRAKMEDLDADNTKGKKTMTGKKFTRGQGAYKQ